MGGCVESREYRNLREGVHEIFVRNELSGEWKTGTNEMSGLDAM